MVMIVYVCQIVILSNIATTDMLVTVLLESIG